jgi:prepilin-type processing-associated H-X9-DG protein/prepilin-type N-terminal cleavage/methylation domain-containing protein
MKTHRQTHSRSQETDLLTVLHRDGKGASAFTLVELLAVSAILAILFALILSGVSQAKLSAQRISCINNLKQWAFAAHLYANEHNDQLPREAALDGINTWEMTADPPSLDVWYNALAQTAGTTMMAQYAQTPSSQQDFYASGKIFHCPRARFTDVAATYPNFSLAMNSKLMGDFERSEPTSLEPVSSLCKVSQIKEPCRTALFLDNGVPGEQRLSPFQAPYTGQPKTFASQFPGRHNRGGNIAFFDGHVLTLAGTKVVDMDPASVFRGRAIFPPGEVIWCPDPASVP